MYNCTVRKETLQHSTVIDFSSHNCCVSMLSAWTSNCEHRVFWLPSWINGWSLFYTVLTKYYLEALSCRTCDSYPDNFFLQVLIFWPGVIVWNSFPSPPISSCCIKENRVSYTTIINYCAIHKPHTVQLETTCKTTLDPLPSELCHLQHGVFSFIAAVIDVVTSAAAAVAGVVFILLTLLLLLLLLFLLLLFFS